MEWFFDSCIKKIVQLIQVHIKRIEDCHSRPKVGRETINRLLLAADCEVELVSSWRLWRICISATSSGRYVV